MSSAPAPELGKLGPALLVLAIGDKTITELKGGDCY